MEYLLHILVLIGIYSILSMSLNLIAGYAGLLSIAHAAFYGVGAYVAALMALEVGSPFLVNIGCAVILSCLVGVLVGIPSLRVRDDYFVIATFALQVITFNVLNNWVSVTGGPMGLPGIPQPSIFSISISSHVDFLLLVGFLGAVIAWLSIRIADSPFGRVLKAIREDEIFALAAGKDVGFFKVIIFTIGAGMASVAGVVYAYYIGFISPSTFTVMESIFIMCIVIIGGSGSVWGPVVGAVFLVVLPEALRFIGLPGLAAANLRQILYGGLLVVFIIWRPHGLLGKYGFYREENRE